MIAARGVAVIVNPSNKLNSLTLDQLRSVFSGELQDWSILAGGVGAGGAAGGAGGAGKQEIKLFGLPQADVVTQIFANECLATDKWRRVTIRKSSDEVIKAVASVTAAMRESRETMLAGAEEFEAAVDEGVEFDGAIPVAYHAGVAGDNGRIGEVEMQRVAVSRGDDGRLSFEPQAGSNFRLPCDHVIISLGQVAGCAC